jgi:hypothetical protein
MKPIAYAIIKDGEANMLAKPNNVTNSDWQPLYATDHAEELAKALEKVRTMLFYLPSSSLNEDVLEILGYIDDKVFNYREATK